MCSLGSQGLTRPWRSLSSTGDLSTMYDIHACLEVGQISSNAERLTCNIPSRLNLRPVHVTSAIVHISCLFAYSRLVFGVLVVDPSCADCPRLSGQLFKRWFLVNIRGSSSSMFSKYLLPYLSMPIKVPRLVSPVQGLSLQSMLPSFYYPIPMFYVAESRVSTGVFLGSSWSGRAYLHLVAEVLGDVSACRMRT